MKFTSRRLALVAGLILPLAAPAAGLAQPAPQPPPGAESGERHHRDPAEMGAHIAEHLRAALQLQPGQEGALGAYLEALKPPPGMRGHRDGDRDAVQHLTTPERLDRMAARMDERRARMQSVIAATRQFYAQLTPSQQKAFDDLPPPMMGHEGHGMRGHGIGGHGEGARAPGGGDRDDMGPGGPPRS